MYFGFWMPRDNDQATFGIDIIRLSACGYQVFVETKNADQADSAATTLGSAQALTTTGITKWTVSGAKGKRPVQRICSPRRRG